MYYYLQTYPHLPLSLERRREHFVGLHLFNSLCKETCLTKGNIYTVRYI